MEPQGGPRQQYVEGVSRVRRSERRRGGGPGGLVAGIATVVIVGVAGKLLLRFNSLKRGNNEIAASAAKDSNDKVVDSGEQQFTATVLKKVLRVVGNQEKHGSNLPSVDTADFAENSAQDFLAEDSDSKCAEIHVKYPFDNAVSADTERDTGSAQRQKSETDPSELVHDHQSVKHSVPSHDDTLNNAKNLEDGIAEVISRAFVDYGSGKLCSQEQAAPKKLTVQVVWDDKPEPDPTDAADVCESVLGSEFPAEDNAEGVTYHSESESGYVVGEYMDARDTYPAAAGDELEVKFSNVETHIEDTRVNSEVSSAECTDWPQAITFSEFINSVQASASAEIKDPVTEDVSALTDEVTKSNSFRFPQLQSDRDYISCRVPSVVHDTFHDQSQEEAESVLREWEARSSSECQEEGEYIFREDPIEDALTERQQHESERKSPEILKDMESAVEEKFEESLYSVEPEATLASYANVDENDAENNVERTLSRTKEEKEDLEENAASTLEDILCVKATGGSGGFSATKETGVREVTLHNAEVAQSKREEEDAVVKAESSVGLPSITCDSESFAKHSRHSSVTDSSRASTAETGITTTMELTTPSNKGGNFSQLGTATDRFATEVLKMAILIALIAAIFFMIHEHHLKPQSHNLQS